MKKLIQTLVLSTALLGTFAAHAGDGPGHQREGKGYHSGERYHQGKGKEGKQHLQYLAKKLDLTEEQKASIAEIYKAHSGEDRRSHKGRFMHGISQLDPSAPDYQAQVAAVAKEQAAKLEQAIIQRGEVHAKVYEVLTPEQRTQLQEMKNKRREKFKNAE